MSQHVRFILLLTVLTLAAYGHVCANDFIDLDDYDYITGNPHVLTGLTAENIRWAFTTTHAHFWQPLTWLSLQLDATLFGPEAAWGFHLTNLLLHLANVLLLYRVLAFMTERADLSFWVAALFAVHPLHVESVAWATERKDVLSTFFWLLAMGAYAWYAERPSWQRMMLTALPFALGLMTKPMLVTLPFALLLLDVWPLGRLRRDASVARFAPATLKRLLVEKTPLFLLAIAAGVLVFAIKRQFYEVLAVSLGARLINAFTSYGWYLWKTFLPIRLGVFYSHPGEDGLALPAVVSALVLAGITLWAIRAAWKRPYLLVGWLWFLGTLVPVIGLVQVGEQARADRFVYVPHIGLFVAVVWLVAALGERRQWTPARISAWGGTILVTLAILTWFQVRHWKTPIDLWEHTVKVTGSDPRAVRNLATLLSKKSDPDDLERAYSVLNEFLSKDHIDYFKKHEVPQAHFLAGVVLSRLQRVPEAIQHYEQALELRPNYPDALNNLGHMLLNQGRVDEAIEQFTRVLEQVPDDWTAHLNLGAALMRQGEYDKAADHFRQTVKGDNTQAAAHLNLGMTLLKLGNNAAAEEQLRRALDLHADHAASGYFLGLSLIRQGKSREAISPLRKVAPQDPQFRSALAYALYHSGDRKAAQEEYDRVTLVHPEWQSESADAAFKLVTHPNPKLRDPQEAFEMALQACQATGFQKPHLLDVLAVTQAAKGDFDAAQKTAAEALPLAEGKPDLVRRLEQRLRLYEKKQPVPPRQP